MNLEREIEIACEIATETGDIVRSYFRTERIGTQAKGDRDVVTAADIAGEKHVLERLLEAFPSDGLVAEEGSARESHSGRRWFLDPLDGTLNFSRGLPIWCVSLALFEGDDPVVGVIRDPLQSETFWAARGHGAWCNDRPMRTSGVSDIEQAVVHLTVDFKDLGLRQGLDDLSRLAPHIMRSRNFGSAALGLAYVAAGRLDAMLHRYAHTWDFAAGAALILEAGGTITDMEGGRYSSSSTSVAAAASPGLHSALMRVLKPAAQVQ